MTENHKKLIASYDEQSKNLRSFVEERGDNITADDLKEAHRIKADLADMRGKIKVAEEAAGLLEHADEARSFLDRPARGHTHPGAAAGADAKVLGATKAGESVFCRPDGSLKRNRALQLVRETGPSAFGKEAFEASSQPEYRSAFRALFKGREKSHPHFRTLQEGLDGQGGYLAPPDVIAKLIEKKPAPTSVASYCNTINTGRDAVSLSRVNYTGATDDSDGSIYPTGVRVTLTDENPSSDTQSQVSDTNLFGSVRVSIFTWMMEVPLTNNEIEDSMFDPMAWISRVFGQTIALHQDRMCILGDPAGPVGLLSNPGGTDTLSNIPVVKTGTGSTPFITPDSLINMTEDIPTQYDENVRYLYRRRTTGKTIRTFKDSQNRYLFGQGYQDSGLVPGRNKVLNDYPVSWSDFMPDPAANAYPVVAGDFGGVTIVNRVGFSLQILREVGARRNQVWVVGRVRYGVQVLEPWRLRALFCSA